MSFDSERKMAEARQRLPLKTLLEQNGFGPRHGGSWKSFQCPLCSHPTAAGVSDGAGTDLFKCFNTGGK